MLWQSISYVNDIAESDYFHDFLRTGVKALKDAHVVSNPPKRRSFLGIVKSPIAGDTLKAEVSLCQE